ncbi:hypothetical protein H072_6253 [Dactylellina haptotyla CBS 200.50]|uniref:Uncharacterized protein n=1 Tax=Dactylellina haptotyla (strain CBS 200.50) TaxID=1284197 RepID=S8BX66_DACHA|nr:hypothetical protein H072_6253 [Dactylellina haptotyla CBS 200.50]
MTAQSKGQVNGEDKRNDPVQKRVPNAQPIKTVIVDSDEFDRITKNAVENQQGIIGSTPIMIVHPTTLATIPRNKSAQSSKVEAVSPTIQSIKTPESKPAISIAQPIAKTAIASGFTEPHTHPQTYLATSNGKVYHGTPTSSAVQKSHTGAADAGNQPHQNVAGIIVGLVVAGVTTAIICLVGLFFFCRHKRRKEFKGKEGGETGRGSGMFAKAKRSASQNSAESRKKLLTRTLTREKTDISEEEPWRPNDAVHYPPYQHIPRNLEGEPNDVEQSDRTNRAASPSSADMPLPDMPIRPPTMEIRNSKLKHRPSLPIELRPFTPSTPPVAGLARPKTSYSNNAPGRYSMAPPTTDRGFRRSSTKTYRKAPPPIPKPRGRAYTLNTLESPSNLAPPAGATDAASTRSISRSPKSDISRRASQSSQRYTIFPKAEPRSSFDGPKALGLVIPGSGSNSSRNSPRPGISRATSYNSLREDRSGIPTVWTKGDSPRASPTRTRAQSGFHGQSYEMNTFPSRSASKRTARLQLVIPELESPIDGTMRSISTTNSSILDTFKRGSGPLVPPKSPLRGNSPAPSTNSKSSSSPVTRPGSPCPTESNVSETSSPEMPVRVRRRNTGFRPDRPLSASPPPALPPLPPLPAAEHIERSQEPQASTAHTSTSSGSTTIGSQTMSRTWSQMSSNTNNRTSGRPHSYSTNTTLSLGAKERPITRFSFFTIHENRNSNQSVVSPRSSSMPSVDGQLASKTVEEAVDSFFQATQQGENETARSSLEEIEDTEPQLARCVSITSTSGSFRTTIDFKPSHESLHSRVLSKGTIRTLDLRLEEAATASVTDIEDVTATPMVSRNNSIASGLGTRRGKARQLRNLTNSTITTDSAAYSPTLSMLNFYSSTARYSMTAGPPSTRSSLATRRNSHVPRISIPQPQLYIHPNTQLEINPTGTDPIEDAENSLSGVAPRRGGSLSSATSPVSFTTAESSNVSYTPPLDTDISAPIPMNTAIPIPTPQIYSSSQEDLSAIHTMRRQGGYPGFDHQKSYGDISSLGVSAKPSMNNLTVHSALGLGPSRLDMYSIGRSVSGGTDSTLDKSSFRDLDMDKSTSGLMESSDDSCSNLGSSDGGEFDLEIGGREGGKRRRSRSLGVPSGMRLKRKRSGLSGDDRGRSMERRLV